VDSVIKDFLTTAAGGKNYQSKSFHQERINEPFPVERQCLDAIREVKQLEESRKRRPKQ
jgi:hypothetical protein